MTTAALAILSAGLMMFFLGLPLAFRKIPMNNFYGFRVQEAFESKQRWYDINAYGGRQMALWSWLVIATGAVGFVFPSTLSLWYALACIPALTIAVWQAVFVPIYRIAGWTRS
jgi:hypothetical protein